MIRTFTKTEFGHTYTSEAKSDDGNVWRWTSNNAVCPLDACKEYGIPCDPAMQEAARQKEVGAFLKDYRKRQRNRKPSAEEMFEMRAAFGRGTTVVNVITGRRTKL